MEFLQKIWSFLTQTPLGLVIISVFSSIIGGILLSLMKRLYLLLLRRYKFEKFKNYLLNMGIAHVHGQRGAVVAMGGGARQAFWAADYVMTFIKDAALVLGMLLITIILLIIIPKITFWIPISIASVLITLKIRMIKRKLNYFDMTVERIFGEEYLKKEQEGYMKYWDTITKKNDTEK